jgi:hypothetical protein
MQFESTPNPVSASCRDLQAGSLRSPEFEPILEGHDWCLQPPIFLISNGDEEHPCINSGSAAHIERQ